MEYPFYDDYKNTDVPWIGKIPSEWDSIRLKFTTYIKGRVGWHGLNSNEFIQEGDFYLVTGTDFKQRKIDWKSCYRFSEDRYDEDPYIHLRNGDLLITKDGTIGKVAQVDNIPHKASVNSGVFVTRPHKEFPYDTGFLYYVLNSGVFKGFIDNQKSGTTISHLYQNIFENFEYSYPQNLGEQQKIADYLDYKTQQIDQLIEKKKALIKKLNEQRIAVITQAITKGIDKNAKMKPSGVDWLGDVPEHWEVLRAKFVSTIFIPQRNKPNLNDSSGIFWATMEDMKSDYIQETQLYVDESEVDAAGSKVLKSGAVIASCIGNFGVASINKVDLIINQQLQAYIPTNINHDFLREVISISSSYFELVGTAATLVYVNQQGFENLPVPLPPEEEQRNIVRYSNQEKSMLNSVLHLTKNAIKTLEEYRSSLITAAVTGKIDIRNIELPSKEAAK
jgi:type I restriction enzyme S subunit